MTTNSTQTVRLSVNDSKNENKKKLIKIVLFLMMADIDQTPVVKKLDNAIHRINRYPVDKCGQNKPRYPLDSNLSRMDIVIMPLNNWGHVGMRLISLRLILRQSRSFAVFFTRSLP